MQRIPVAPLPALGDLPEAPIQAAWMGANQLTGYTRVIQDPFDFVRELEIGISDADKDQVGGRAFHNLPDGRWLTEQPYLGKWVRHPWKVFIPKLDLVDGDNKWITCGLEIKNDTSPNALVQTNITQIGDHCYYWLNGAGIGSTPIPMNTWHDVYMDVLLGLKGEYALTFGDDYLYARGPTCRADGLAGVALCFYGNNLATPKPYFARFRHFAPYLLN